MRNLQGKRFGRLVVECRVPGGAWLCRCDCGLTSIAITGNLKRKNSRSCGCAWKEAITTHGLTDTLEYRTWKAMHHRCRSIKPHLFPHYAGRGIKVCDEWSDFTVFLRDMGKRPSRRHQLDREDNDAGYSKDNCRWALPQKNLNNKRNNHYINFEGRRQTIAEWALERGINYRTLNNRINRGWPIARAMEIIR